MKQRGWPLALFLALSSTTSAATPATTASAAPSAAAAPSASPRTALLRGIDVPEAASPPPPSHVDWEQHARVLAPNRGESGPCKLKTLREWVRVECPKVPGAGLVAGDPSGVRVEVSEARSGADGHESPLTTTLSFPLRRGAALLFAFLALDVEYNSEALVDGGTLSVVWRAGKPDPVLAMHGIPLPPSFTPGAGDDSP